LRDRRLPGDGDFDIAGFVAAVRATGFRGPWGVEVLSAVIGDLTLPDDSAARASLELAELARRAYRSTIEHVARDRYERSGREAGDDKEA
jgi:sugar phosphate isomerase/epimerase